MEHYKGKMFARKDCAELQVGDTLTDCNLAQENAHTVLACHGRAITFIRCNLHNVEIWPEAVIVDCGMVGVHRNLSSYEVPPLTAEEDIEAQLGSLEKQYSKEQVKDVVKNKYKLDDKK